MMKYSGCVDCIASEVGEGSDAGKVYNFAKRTSEDSAAISVAHRIEHCIKISTSRKLFSAWRHILTRSFPFGTVGHVIGRTFSPRALKRAAKRRGYDVIKGIIGVGSFKGDNGDGASGWRCSGSDRISGVIGVSER